MSVTKKDGTRRHYDREKKRRVVQRACEKRQITNEEIDFMVERIDCSFRNKNIMEISSKSIGVEVMGELKKLDKIAYIRFASVYREFADIDDFKDALRKL